MQDSYYVAQLDSLWSVVLVINQGWRFSCVISFLNSSLKHGFNSNHLESGNNVAKAVSNYRFIPLLVLFRWFYITFLSNLITSEGFTFQNFKLSTSLICVHLSSWHIFDSLGLYLLACFSLYLHICTLFSGIRRRATHHCVRKVYLHFCIPHEEISCFASAVWHA